MTEAARSQLAQVRLTTAAVIPAYREEKHISDIVHRTRLQLDHVLVVDDGSNDQTARRAREAGCEVLTMGQYLRPTPKHLPVVEYIPPDQFNYYGDIARKKGFLHVASGPLVRSSYHADDFHPVVRR